MLRGVEVAQACMIQSAIASRASPEQHDVARDGGRELIEQVLAVDRLRPGVELRGVVGGVSHEEGAKIGVGGKRRESPGIIRSDQVGGWP